MTDRDLVSTLSVEERLRICLTLTKGLYHVLEVAGEHEGAALQHFQPSEVLTHIPELTRALRDQLVAVRAALPFECLSREAPIARISAPPGAEPAGEGDDRPDSPDEPRSVGIGEHESQPVPQQPQHRARRPRKGGAR
jgi:hypothetical protein